jgi:hypothetical protein
MRKIYVGAGMVQIAVALLCTAPSAFAASTRSECHGILHSDHGSLVLGGGAGEGEAICVVAGSEQGKVLKGCSVGAFCRAHGGTKPCEDSGECVEIGRIDRVQKR